MILDNFPAVLWINLDRSQNRREYMEKLMEKYCIKNTRIRAIDGLDKNLELFSVCHPNTKRSKPENACTCSHLTAIKYFVDCIPDDKIIIFEDDVSFEFLELIPFNWSEFEKNLPKDYGLIQLAITRENALVSSNMVKTDPSMKYFCSAAYLITKKTAIELLDKYYSKKTGKIDLANNIYTTADAMIASTGKTYSIPIFTYQSGKSTIHPMHYYIHYRSKQQQHNMWNQIANDKTFDNNDYFCNSKKIDF